MHVVRIAPGSSPHSLSLRLASRTRGDSGASRCDVGFRRRNHISSVHSRHGTWFHLRMRGWTLGTIGIVAVVAVVAGCADPSPAKQVPPVARIDLTAALGSASVHPIGVAVAPSGDRFVFDQTLGLYR